MDSFEDSFEDVYDSVYRDIRSDLYRYSKLRAWFRYLPFSGRSYLLFPWVGEQPRNEIDTSVDDTSGLHWWVWDADFIDELPIDGVGKDIIMRRPVVFNCFLRGLDGDPGGHYLRGLDVIKARNTELPAKVSFDYALGSHEQQLETAIEIAIEIYHLMEENCPQWIDNPGSQSSESPIERPIMRRTQSEYIPRKKRKHGRFSDLLSRKKHSARSKK